MAIKGYDDIYKPDVSRGPASEDLLDIDDIDLDEDFELDDEEEKVEPEEPKLELPTAIETPKPPKVEEPTEVTDEPMEHRAIRGFAEALESKFGKELPQPKTTKAEAFTAYATDLLGITDMVKAAYAAGKDSNFGKRLGPKPGSIAAKLESGERLTKEEYKLLENEARVQQPGMKEKFYKELDKFRAEKQQMFEEHPASAISGMMAEGLIMSLIPGLGYTGYMKRVKHLKELEKVAKAKNRLKHLKTLREGRIAAQVKEARKMGTRAGAIVGATKGESKLLEGEVLDTVTDIGAGTLGGGALGWAAGGAVEWLPNFAMKLSGIRDFVEATQAAFRGTSVAGEQAVRNLSKKLRGLSHKINNELNHVLKVTGKEKTAAYDKLEELGFKLNFKDELEELYKEVQALPEITPEQQQSKATLLSEMQTFMGFNKDMQKAQKQLKTGMAKKLNASARKSEIKQARIKARKKRTKEIVQTTEKPITTEEYVTTPEQLGAGPSPRKEQMYIREDIVPRTTPEGEPYEVSKRIAEDISKFEPSPITTGYEPKTGMKVMGYEDISTGKVTNKAFETQKRLYSEKLSPEQIQSFEKIMQNLAKKPESGGLGDFHARELAKKSLRTMQDKLAKVSDKQLGKDYLKELNKKLHVYLQGKELLSLEGKYPAEVKKEIINLSEVLKKSIDPASRDYSLIDEFLGTIAKDSPERARDYQNIINQVSNQFKLAGLSVQEGMPTPGAIATARGPFRSLAVKAGEATGKKARNLRLNVKKRGQLMQQELFNMAPEGLSKMAKEMIDMGGEFARYGKMVLDSVQDRKAARAIIFGLIQRPKFQDVYNKYKEQKDIETLKTKGKKGADELDLSDL